MSERFAAVDTDHAGEIRQFRHNWRPVNDVMRKFSNRHIFNYLRYDFILQEKDSHRSRLHQSYNNRNLITKNRFYFKGELSLQVSQIDTS